MCAQRDWPGSLLCNLKLYHPSQILYSYGSGSDSPNNNNTPSVVVTTANDSPSTGAYLLYAGRKALEPARVILQPLLQHLGESVTQSQCFCIK